MLSERLRSLLTEPHLLCWVAILAALASAVVSLLVHDWLWFGRSGSAVTLCGTLLTVRRLIRVGPGGLAAAESAPINGGEFPGDNPAQEAAESAAAAENALDHRAAGWGAALLVIGTLMWGYGDLVNRALGWPLPSK